MSISTSELKLAYNNFTATIYKYFEPGVRLTEFKNGIEKPTNNFSFVCNYCKKMGIKNKSGGEVTIKAAVNTSSNLTTHLKCESHKEIYEKYQSEVHLNPSQATKRKLEYENSPINLLSNPAQLNKQLKLNLNDVPTSPKYSSNSIHQKTRYFALVVMLIKCMLPVSLVERLAFRQFLAVFDPCFIFPDRKGIKNYGVVHLRELVTNKINLLFKRIAWLNTCCDGWADASLRCFNGYVAQGICDDWKMNTVNIAFEHVTGKNID